MTERERLVRLAALPIVKMSPDDARFLTDWIEAAQPEEVRALMDEAHAVRRRLDEADL